MEPEERRAVCASQITQTVKEMLDHMLRIFLRQNFYCFPWAHGCYHFMINGQLLQRERNKKIAEGLLAGSKVSLTKSKFYQTKEYWVTSTPERELWRHNNQGPCFTGQIGKLNSMSSALPPICRGPLQGLSTAEFAGWTLRKYTRLCMF